MVSTFVQDATGPRVDALRRRLARESDTTAAAAIPGAEGAALLRRMLGDPDPRVRADAAFALARRDRRAAVTALIALLADPDEATRRHANRALTEAAGADQGTTMYRWRAWAKGQGL
jgi:HEAT repeat protein